MAEAGSFSAELVANRPRLRRFALSVAKNHPDADDLVQDTMVRALAKQDQFTPGTNMLSWLCTILLNQFRADLRRHWRMVQDGDNRIAEMTEANDDQASAYEAKDAISRICLLSDIHQRVLLQAFNGVTLEDIARSEGVPLGTIKSRVSRARASFVALVNG